ncbi:MAG: hypothetical protein E7379_01310 [Clostridiales bacterium]|nr:hypothetical protein [Clostridiales bacterium]
MIIKKVHIDNFGRLQDKEFSFGEGLNQLLNENGWGKTTLSIFIKAMFYGMPPARDNVKNERKKYMPWQGGNFGGWIEFAADKGDFRITRVFGKTPEGDSVQLFNLKHNCEVPLPKEELGEWLFGVGRETFEMTAFFPQTNFTASINEQISAGVLGLDKFKYDLANVGQAVANIKKEMLAIKKNIVKSSEIERLKRQKSDLEQDISQANLHMADLQQNIEKLQKQNIINAQNLEKEKIRLQEQEKIFASQMQIENALKAENEKLSNLLLQKGDKNSKKGYLIGIWAVAFAVILSGIVLGVIQTISWLVAGVIGAIITILATIVSIKYFKKVKSGIASGEKSKDLRNLIKNCQDRIQELNVLLQSFNNVIIPNKVDYELQQEIVFSSKLNLERLLAQKESLGHQKERLLLEIESLSLEIEQKETNNKMFAERLRIYELTNDYLIEAKDNVSKRFVGPINEEMNNLLAKFDMRGREFVVDANFDIKQSTHAGFKEFEYSSQGYKDILSLCMRLILINQVYKNDKPCIILDDSFVNLDDKNFEKAKLVIDEFSNKIQILYITCNESKRIY